MRRPGSRWWPDVAAHATARRGRSGEVGRFALGVLVGLLAVATTVVAALWVLGYIGGAEPAPRQDAIHYPAEPRPTPYWPFREEWLTPRPKG